jgi:hypothetical protein
MQRERGDRMRIIVALVVLAVIAYIASSSREPTQSPEQLVAVTAQKAEAEAKCAVDLQCLGDKKIISASFKCAPLIERLAKNNFEWIDAWYETKLSHFRWKDKDAKIITFIGDRIKFQNGFGAWVISKYECDYNALLDIVLDVRASPGRID